MINKFKLSLFLAGFITMPLASYAGYPMDIHFFNKTNTTFQEVKGFQYCVTDPNPANMNITLGETDYNATADTGGDCSYNPSVYEFVFKLTTGETVAAFHCVATDGTFDHCAINNFSSTLQIKDSYIGPYTREIDITPVNAKQ